MPTYTKRNMLPNLKSTIHMLMKASDIITPPQEQISSNISLSKFSKLSISGSFNHNIKLNKTMKYKLVRFKYKFKVKRKHAATSFVQWISIKCCQWEKGKGINCEWRTSKLYIIFHTKTFPRLMLTLYCTTQCLRTA